MKSLFTQLFTQREEKRQIFLLLPILVVLALVGAACNHSDDAASVTASTRVSITAATTRDTTATTATTATTRDTTAAANGVKVGLIYDIGGRGSIGGTGYNDSAFVGIDRAEKELGISYNEAVPNLVGSNRGALIDLQSESQDFVIAVGFLFGSSILEAATSNPDVLYAIVDDGPNPNNPSPANLAHLVFAEEQGSYLVGVAAALTTTTDKVAFIGGVRTPLIQDYEVGFVAGVKATNPSIEVTVEYITDPPDFGGFNDPAQARVIADRLYQAGNDVIYHSAGGSGNGLFESAKAYRDETDTTVWVIGTDIDQYNRYNAVDDDLKEVILTSMLKHVDVAVFSIIQDVVNDTFTGGPEAIIYDLSVDGVGYATSGNFLSSDAIAAIEAAKAAIIAGEVLIPSVF